MWVCLRSELPVKLNIAQSNDIRIRVRFINSIMQKEKKQKERKKNHDSVLNVSSVSSWTFFTSYGILWYGMTVISRFIQIIKENVVKITTLPYTTMQRDLTDRRCTFINTFPKHSHPMRLVEFSTSNMHAPFKLAWTSSPVVFLG